ncbi:hypothetical protein WME73_11820 [Sorangium sp. So ce302]|uniref:hypothetical protein n=1 Tax=Sorangium sp. So ce302 TaxID=3133297 RepID=UPI003F62C6A0
MMVHFDEQRAHEAHAQGQSPASPGPGALIGGIGAIFLGLSWTIGVFMRPELDLWLLDSIASVIAWLGAGIVLIASHAKRANKLVLPPRRLRFVHPTAQVVAGARRFVGSEWQSATPNARANQPLTHSSLRREVPCAHFVDVA